MEQVISDIINQFGEQLWLAFVTLVVTGFILILVKGFIQNLADYFKAKMSDIGYGQRIYWKNEIYIVDRITFKHIVVKDDKRIIHIPIEIYISGPREYPLTRYDDFDEIKYHEKPWDGAKERRSALDNDKNSI